MLSALVLTALAIGNCEADDRLWQTAGLPSRCSLLQSTHDREGRIAALEQGWHTTRDAAQCARDANTSAAWEQCIRAAPSELSAWVGLITASDDAGGVSGRWEKLEPLLAQNKPALIAHLVGFVGPEHPFVRKALIAATPGGAQQVFDEVALDGDDLFDLSCPLIFEGAKRATPLSHGQWTHLIQGCLSNALDLNELRFANELIAALPAPIQTELLNHPDEFVRRGLDARRLGFAAYLSGHRVEAKRLLAQEPEVRFSVDGSHGDYPELLRAIEQLQDGQKPSIDAWEATTKFRQSNLFGPDWLPLVLPLVGNSRASLINAALMPRELWKSRPSRLDDHRHAVLRQSQQALLALGGDPSLFERTPLQLPSPIDVWTRTPADRIRHRAIEPLSQQPSIPAGFVPIRAERDGSRWVVLAQGRMGLWLLISPDHKIWNEIFLGIESRSPVATDHSSDIPLLEGDRVRLDSKGLDLPGIDRDTGRDRVILEASLSALRKDSDHDGLSDLVEERLLLNPNDPDTDGDGIPDGIDRTPRRDDRKTGSKKVEALNALLCTTGTLENLRETKTSPPRADQTACSTIDRPNTGRWEDPDFIVAPADDLDGLKPRGVVITLAVDEFMALQRRSGTFSATRLDVQISDDGRHVLITWSAPSAGGTIRGDLNRDGTWTFTSIDSWVT